MYIRFLIPLALSAVLLLSCTSQDAKTPPISKSAGEAIALSAVETTPSPNDEPAEHAGVKRSTEESTLTFVGGSSIVDHAGWFDTFSVILDQDAEDPSNYEKAKLDVVIDMKSIQSDNERLTGHFMKEDFFAVDQYPVATFTSTAIRSVGNDAYKVTGTLSIKGIRKSVTLDAVITESGMSVRYSLPRREYGIGKDSYKDKLLDEYVPVEAEAVFE